VLCSRASRSSVPSSIPPGEHGKEDGTEVVPLPVLTAVLVRRVLGGQVRAKSRQIKLLRGVRDA